jgi:DNA-binding response OmpR family regulator
MLEGHGQKVIVVDNDRTVLELLQIRLEVVGYHAYITRTGAQALDLLKHVRPAAMILDVGLADANGFDLLHTIRNRYADLHFPILVTGRGLTGDDVRRALGYGAQNCMIKPYSGSDAVERIGRLIEAFHRPAAHPIELTRPQAVA